MKKILLILLAVALLCGCQKTPEAQPQTEPSTQRTQTTEGDEASVDIGMFEDSTAVSATDPQSTKPTVSGDPEVPVTGGVPSAPSAPTESTVHAESTESTENTQCTENTEPAQTTASTLPETEDSGYYKPILRP